MREARARPTTTPATSATGKVLPSEGTSDFATVTRRQVEQLRTVLSPRVSRIEASFAPDADKQRWMHELKQTFERFVEHDD